MADDVRSRARSILGRADVESPIIYDQRQSMKGRSGATRKNRARGRNSTVGACPKDHLLLDLQIPQFGSAREHTAPHGDEVARLQSAGDLARVPSQILQVATTTERNDESVRHDLIVAAMSAPSQSGTPRLRTEGANPSMGRKGAPRGGFCPHQAAATQPGGALTRSFVAPGPRGTPRGHDRRPEPGPAGRAPQPGPAVRSPRAPHSAAAQEIPRPRTLTMLAAPSPQAR